MPRILRQILMTPSHISFGPDPCNSINIHIYHPIHPIILLHPFHMLIHGRYNEKMLEFMDNNPWTLLAYYHYYYYSYYHILLPSMIPQLHWPTTTTALLLLLPLIMHDLTWPASVTSTYSILPVINSWSGYFPKSMTVAPN